MELYGERTIHWDWSGCYLYGHKSSRFVREWASTPVAVGSQFLPTAAHNCVEFTVSPKRFKFARVRVRSEGGVPLKRGFETVWSEASRSTLESEQKTKELCSMNIRICLYSSGHTSVHDRLFCLKWTVTQKGRFPIVFCILGVSASSDEQVQELTWFLAETWTRKRSRQISPLSLWKRVRVTFQLVCAHLGAKTQDVLFTSAWFAPTEWRWFCFLFVREKHAVWEFSFAQVACFLHLRAATEVCWGCEVTSGPSRLPSVIFEALMFCYSYQRVRVQLEAMTRKTALHFVVRKKTQRIYVFRR